MSTPDSFTTSSSDLEEKCTVIGYSDPEYAGGITWPIWLWNALGYFRNSWRMWLGRGASGLLCILQPPLVWSGIKRTPVVKDYTANGLLGYVHQAVLLSFQLTSFKVYWGLQF